MYLRRLLETYYLKNFTSALGLLDSIHIWQKHSLISARILLFFILLYIRQCLNAHTLCANLGLNAHTLCAKQSYICIRAFKNDDIV